MNSLKISTRIQILLALALAGLLALSLFALFQLKGSMLSDRQDKLTSQVETAISVFSHFHKLSQEGKLGEDAAKLAAKETLRNLRYSGSEYFFVYDRDGVNFMHPTTPSFEGKNRLDAKDAVGKQYIKELIDSAGKGGGFVDYMWVRTKDQPAEPKLSYGGMFAPWGLVVATGVFIDDIDKAYWGVAKLFAAISLILAALLGLLGWQLGRGILRQLGGEPAQASQAMQRVAGGDLSLDLGKPVEGSLLHSLAGMVVSLRQMIGEINANAQQLVSNAARITAASESGAQSAGHQSDATSSMAAAIEELTVSSSHISDNAGETSRDSSQAVELAGQGTERVNQAATAIEKISQTVSDASSRIHALEERAQQVSSIANVIKDIAGQTNLLALNAAIEAARAGEQGRGFAVVADEVRKLAERTSLATTEIEQMIGGIQGDTVGAVGAMSEALPEVRQGVELAGLASESLGTIEQGARRTLERIAEIANATKEQSAASTSIAQRVEEISRMVEETANSSRSIAASARELEGIADQLKRQIDRFKL